MGLVLKVGDLKCYTEEYDPAKHQKLLVGVKRGGKTYVPAETVGRLLLYDYDEDAHKIIIINPIPTAKGFSIKAVDEAEDNQVQSIGIQCDVVDNQTPKGRSVCSAVWWVCSTHLRASTPSFTSRPR